MYNRDVRFEWDPRKARDNLRKHGVSFREASTVFFDSLSVTGDDPDHSVDERRWVIFGISSAGRPLIVSYAERRDTIRIISGREMDPGERHIYEEG